MSKRLGLFFSCVLVLTLFSHAQNAPSTGRTSVHGKVRDAVTNQALEHVIVFLEDQNSGYSGQSETDGLGRFDFQGMRPAVYMVRVRFSGYQEASERIDLTVTGSNYVDFQLKPLHNNSAAPAEGPGGALSATAAGASEKARKEFETGRKLLADGHDLEGATNHLLKAIKEYPSFADAYVPLGMAYMQTNKPDEAKAALEKAIQLDAKLVPAYVTLGMIQNYGKDYVSAEKNLTRALELSPDSPQAHYELAKAYWSTGHWQDAEPHAAKCTSLQPQMAPAHVLLGNILLRKNNPQGALKEFQAYLQLDPKGPMANGVQNMVQKLQSSAATKP